MESSAFFEREAGEVPLPPPPSRNRDGLSALERKALYRVHTELPAMPASLVVQILLWPEKITDWARDERVTPALVYNMLGGFKPYHGLRQRLAQRLGVTKAAVDHLIDARRQQPSTRKIPEPPPDFPSDDVAMSSSGPPARGAEEAGAQTGHGTAAEVRETAESAAASAPSDGDEMPSEAAGAQTTLEL